VPTKYNMRKARRHLSDLLSAVRVHGRAIVPGGEDGRARGRRGGESYETRESCPQASEGDLRLWSGVRRSTDREERGREEKKDEDKGEESRAAEHSYPFLWPARFSPEIGGRADLGIGCAYSRRFLRLFLEAAT